jgi:hypothetical protein
MARTPQDIAAKQIRRLSDAVEDIKAGVGNVTVSPTMLAAANLDKARTNYQKAIDSGKMANNLKAVSLQTWIAKTQAKVNRIPEGIAAAAPTLVQFHTQREAMQTGISNTLGTMPTRTLQDGINRMVAQVTGMSKFSFDKSKV